MDLQYLHHPPSTFEFSAVCGVNNEIEPSVKYRNFKGADYKILIRKIDLTNWELVLPINDSNLCANSFYKELNKIIDENVPLKTVYSNSFPHWFSKELNKCIADKRKAHYLFRNSSCTYYFNHPLIQEFSPAL